MTKRASCPELQEFAGDHDMARTLDISVKNLGELISKGVLIRGRQAGTYPLVENVHRYVAYIKQTARKDLDGERIRRLRNENERMEGEVLPQVDARDANLTFVQLVKSHVEGISGRIAVEFARITDAAVIRARHREEVAAAFNAAYEALKPFFAPVGVSATRLGKPADSAAEKSG